MTMKAAPAEMGTAAVQSSRLCILYAARRNRLRRRARDLLFGNQRIPGVFCSGVTENCQRTRTAGLSALCCAVFPCNTQSIPAEKWLAQHENSSLSVTFSVFRFTLENSALVRGSVGTKCAGSGRNWRLFCVHVTCGAMLR